MHFIDHRSRLPNTVFISYSATDQDLKQLPGLHYAADIRELRLQGGNFSDRALESVALLPGLERLWLEGEKFTDAGLEAVGRILTLRELRLSWTNVDGNGLKHLARLHKLRRLNLCFGHSTLGAGLEALSELPALSVLDLHGYRVNSAVFAGLGTLSRVAHLNLSNGLLAPGVDSADMAGIAQMSGLRKVELHASAVAPGIVPHLVGLLPLEELDLKMTELSAADVASLNALCNLRRLSLPYVPDTALLALTALNRLEHLAIDDWSLPPHVVAQLKAASPGLEIEYMTMNYDK